MWNFLVRWQRKIIDATPMRRGSTILVAGIEALLGAGFLWFMQSWMPFSFWGDMLAIACVTSALVVIFKLVTGSFMAVGDDSERGSLDVVTEAMRVEEEDERPDWHQDTLGLDVVTDDDRPVSTARPAPPRVRHLFRSMFSTTKNAALVLSVFAVAGAVVWLCQKAGLGASWTFGLGLGSFVISALVGALIALPSVDQGGVHRVNPIKGSSATHRYLVRVEGEEIYYDEVRHWTYFVAELFSKNTFAVTLLAGMSVYVALANPKGLAIYLLGAIALLGWRVHYAWKHRYVWNEEERKPLPSVKRLLSHLFAPLSLAIYLITSQLVATLTNAPVWQFTWVVAASVVLCLRLIYCWVKWRYTRLVLTSIELAIVSTFPFKLRRNVPRINIKALQASDPYWTYIGEKLNFGRYLADTASTRDEKFHHLRNISNLHVLVACVKKLSST